MDSVIGTDRSRETLRTLRESITSGRWPLNSRIPTEAELMAELGVGRSTVREAVRSLAALGMLEPARSRGTFVRSLSPVSGVLSDFVDRHTPSDILAVRRTLETEAARQAALHRTADHLDQLEAAYRDDVEGNCAEKVERGATPGQFHGLVLEASGNALLRELYWGLMGGLRKAQESGEVAPGQSPAERHHDHRALLDALRDQDGELAATLAAEHAARDLVADSADVTELTADASPAPAE